MTTTHTPGKGGAGGAQSQTEPAAPDAAAKKVRRTPAPRIPAGMQQIKFLLPQAEYDELTKIGDLDDRKPDDLARVLTRKHIRSNSKTD